MLLLLINKKIADVSAGKNIFTKSIQKSGDSSQEKQSDFYFINSYDILKNEIIHENDINLNSLKVLKFDNGFDVIKYKLKRNDIIIANRSFVDFKASIIDFDIDNIYVSSNFLVIRPNPNKINSNEINPMFLLFYLNKPSTQAALIEKIMKNKKITSENSKKSFPMMLKTSDIPVEFMKIPTIEEQNKIVDEILSDMEKVKELEKSIAERKDLIDLS